MLISVIVPAFNEGSELYANLRELLRVLDAPTADAYEVLLVDDGSSDDTYGVACRLAEDRTNLHVLRHAQNRGLGGALRTGFEHAAGDAFVVYDSDMSYDPAIVPQLAATLETSHADLVLASPYMRGGSVKNVPWLRRVLSREANRFLSFATNGKYATVTCMVRAYRASLARSIPSTEPRMEVNVELLFKAIKAGARIVEIPARLQWSRQRACAPSRLKPRRAFQQIWRTFQYGVRHRPAVLLALPGILPGVLPLIVGLTVLAHASLRTLAMVTLITMIVQNTSLALFAGQLAAFFRNVLRPAHLPGHAPGKGPPVL